MRSETEKLGTEPVFGLLLKLALPAMAGLLIGNLYVMVDRVFVGRYVGETGLAAMTAVQPIVMIIWGIAILIGRGGQVLYSIALGEKNYPEVQRLFGQNLALCLLAASVITAGGLVFLDPLLFFFGVTKSALADGRAYLSVSLYGTLFVMLGFQNNFIRAEGYSALAMGTQILGAAVNVLLDWWFMAGFGMGMTGAALATIIAQAVSAAWVLSFFLSKRSIAKVAFSSIRFYGLKKVWKTLYNGISPFSIGISGSVIWTVQNHMLILHGGDLALAAFGVILTVAQFLFTPVFGICMGMQPLVGYNTGARKFGRVILSFRDSCLVGAAVALPVWLFVMIFPEFVMKLFAGDHAKLIELGAFSMRGYLMLAPLGAGITIFVSQYFQAIGKPLYALGIALCRQLIFELSLALILPQYFGYAGVVFAAPAGDCIASVIAFVLMRRELARLRECVRLAPLP